LLPVYTGFLLSNPENGGDMFRQKDFNGIHCAMSQKTEIFITTARTSKPYHINYTFIENNRSAKMNMEI
jgi:hypothetical protein